MITMDGAAEIVKEESTELLNDFLQIQESVISAAFEDQTFVDVDIISAPMIELLTKFGFKVDNSHTPIRISW